MSWWLNNLRTPHYYFYVKDSASYKNLIIQIILPQRSYHSFVLNKRIPVTLAYPLTPEQEVEMNEEGEAYGKTKENRGKRERERAKTVSTMGRTISTIRTPLLTNKSLINSLHAICSFSFRHSQTVWNRLHWGPLSHPGDFLHHSQVDEELKYSDCCTPLMLRRLWCSCMSYWFLVKGSWLLWFIDNFSLFELDWLFKAMCFFGMNQSLSFTVKDWSLSSHKEKRHKGWCHNGCIKIERSFFLYLLLKTS